MSLLDHAKREFLIKGYKPVEECEDDPNKWIQEAVLELIETFANQGHSGMSASFAISYFYKLAQWLPLSPIMGTDDEWNDRSKESGKEFYQNNRCSAVFKDGETGQSSYIHALSFVDQNGDNWSGSAVTQDGEVIKSSQNISFPFIPKTFNIDVFTIEDPESKCAFMVKDIKQLEEALEYFRGNETEMVEIDQG